MLTRLRRLRAVVSVGLVAELEHCRRPVSAVVGERVHFGGVAEGLLPFAVREATARATSLTIRRFPKDVLTEGRHQGMGGL